MLGEEERRRPWRVSLLFDDPPAKDDQNDRSFPFMPPAEFLGVGVLVPKKVGESGPPLPEPRWSYALPPTPLEGAGDIIRWEGRCCAKCEAETPPADAEDEAADTDWERRTTLLELPIEVMDEPAAPALLVGDNALPYGRETALLSRDRWARCC